MKAFPPVSLLHSWFLGTCQLLISVRQRHSVALPLPGVPNQTVKSLQTEGWASALTLELKSFPHTDRAEVEVVMQKATVNCKNIIYIILTFKTLLGSLYMPNLPCPSGKGLHPWWNAISSARGNSSKSGTEDFQYQKGRLVHVDNLVLTA